MFYTPKQSMDRIIKQQIQNIYILQMIETSQIIFFSTRRKL